MELILKMQTYHSKKMLFKEAVAKQAWKQEFSEHMNKLWYFLAITLLRGILSLSHVCIFEISIKFWDFFSPIKANIFQEKNVTLYLAYMYLYIWRIES